MHSMAAGRDGTMTPPQRLWAAMSGAKPDRVPVVPKIWIDLAANLTSSDLRSVLGDSEAAMQVIPEAALRVGADGARLFLFPPRRIVESNGAWQELDAEGRNLGEVDRQGGLGTKRAASEFNLENQHHVAFRGSWVREKPFVNSMADAGRIRVPDRSFFNSLGFGAMLRRMIDRYGKRIGLIGDCESATLSFYEGFRGTTEALMDLIDQPRLVHAVMEKGEMNAVERGKLCLDAGLRILRLNDSMANMSVISPGQWREFIRPHISAVCSELHRYEPSAKIYCHICGNVMPVIDLLAATGLDCIAPLDPLGGFSVADARRAVGPDKILMGGVNTLSFVRCKPEDTLDEARRCIAEGAVAGRNFILGSGCAVPRGASADNLRALARASEMEAVNEPGGRR